MQKEYELVRIFIGEGDKHGHLPLYEAIVQEARSRGLAGATVIRGIIGFGKNSKLRTTKILCLSLDLPILVEIIDESKKLAKFLPDLNKMIKQGLVTSEKVTVLINRHNGGYQKSEGTN